ncbi:non-ribosomal peptide synthase, partial [Streptococcus agalactiae]|nr:non-ribosomal peptide synthase [Streptococcus agalactiae]
IIRLSEKYVDISEVKQGDKLLICEDVSKRVILTYLFVCLSSGATLKLEKKFLKNRDSTKKENLTLIHITSQQLEMLRENPTLQSKLKSYMFKTIIFSVRASSMCLDNQYIEMLNGSKVIYMLDDFTIEEDEHYLALYKEHKETDSNNSVFTFDENLSSGDI